MNRLAKCRVNRFVLRFGENELESYNRITHIENRLVGTHWTPSLETGTSQNGASFTSSTNVLHATSIICLTRNVKFKMESMRSYYVSQSSWFHQRQHHILSQTETTDFFSVLNRFKEKSVHGLFSFTWQSCRILFPNGS